MYKSITVIGGRDGTIYIHDDLMYTGRDNCVQCRFNPCRIKKWYGYKNIENCKLWNKVDPSNFGNIQDVRP